MTRISLRPGVPMDMALATTEGRSVESKWKGKQMEFRTVDERVLYVPIDGGHQIQAQLRDLGIRKGERILITQEKAYTAAGAEITYQVHRIERPLGEQADGTFVVPSQPGAQDPAAPPAPPRWTDSLLAHTNAMTDVYAAALAYAQAHHGDRVQPADVRELMLAAFEGLVHRGRL